MAGTTVATWVKVKTKNGLKSTPISLKDGGGNFVKGQTITESEYREVLKKKGDRLEMESKPFPPIVRVEVDRGDRKTKLVLPDEVAKEFALTDGSVISESLYPDVKKRDKEFSRMAQGSRPPAINTKEIDSWHTGNTKQSPEQNNKDLAALKRKLKSLPEEKRDQHLIQWMQSNASAPSSKRAHSMALSEKMFSVKIGTLSVHFSAEDPTIIGTAAQTMRAYMATKAPTGLTKHTTDIYFSKQENSAKAYWEKLYGPRGDIIASGGRGAVVIYGNNFLRADYMIHEMGHNLADAIYGNTEPPKNSKFALITKRIKGEKTEMPPSTYGRNNKAEDFAESVRFYVENPVAFRESHPKRYDIINNAIEKGVE